MSSPRFLRSALSLMLLAVSGCSTIQSGGPKPAPPPANGREVVQRMFSQYEGKWYQTLQFTQENTRYLANGRTDRSQWKEYMLVPGRLRIEFLPATGGNGAVYADGNVYSFEGGRLTRTTPQINVLLVLTADVYAQPVETSVRQLTGLGIDMAKLRSDTWEKRPVWVVGSTGPADLGSPQFWIDAETWVVVRVVDRLPLGTAQGPRPATEYQLTDYRTVSGIPMVHQITFLRDGKPFFLEQYTQVVLNGALDARLFSSTQWRAAAAKP